MGKGGDDGIRRTRVVRPPAAGDTLREDVARQAVVDRWDDLGAATGGRAGLPQYAWHLGTAVIDRDDEHGRQLGQVVRGDLVTWADLVLVAQAAVGTLDPAHGGACPVGCPSCDLRRALGRIRESSRTAVRAGVDFAAPVSADGVGGGRAGG